jgi:hypothetical protein
MAQGRFASRSSGQHCHLQWQVVRLLQVSVDVARVSRPATALLEQVRHDPDGDALCGLMTEWHAVFGSTPTTVRKAVEAAICSQPNLLDAMREFPVEERGEINRSKLGWLLKKNANRIVGGFEFQQAEADGRTAWRVVAVESPPLTPSPPFAPSIEKTVTRWSGRI